MEVAAQDRELDADKWSLAYVRIEQSDFLENRIDSNRFVK